MRIAHPHAQRGALGLSALLVIALLAAAIAGYFLYAHFAGTGTQEADDKDVPFALVDGAHRELDGSPALALSFSLPLDSRNDYGKYVQVLEMPPKATDRPDQNDAGMEDSDGGGDGQAGAATERTSRAQADTNTEGGKPVSGAWVVGENPRLLFFPHIKPQTRYVVRVLPGLPARSGARLEGEERLSILTAAIPASFYFASRGTVLPAKQNGGLPVTTVNVPEVDIQFLKVKPDQLPAFLEKVVSGAPTSPDAAGSEEGEGGEEGYYGNITVRLKGAVTGWELDRLHKLTDSVFTGRFLTEQKPNRRAVTFIPVENIKALAEPGVYVAVMSQPNRFREEYQTTYFYVSDLGLHLRQFSGGAADAYVSSLTSGKAVTGVEVSWIDAQGKILRRGESDSEGRANFAERPAKARLLMAKKGEQMSLITLKEPALDLNEYDIAGMPPSATRLFAWSGRDLYRPGERFEVSVMARDADGRAVAPQPVQATLRRPDGKAQWSAAWQPQAQFPGYYRQAIELPPDAATGFWYLELSADPAAKRAGTRLRFGVEEFLPERMKLDLAGHDPKSGAPGWTIDISGRYLYGTPAAGNRLIGVVNSERNRNPLQKKLPGFIFGDSDEDSVRSRIELDETALDDKGQAQTTVSLEPVAKRHSPFTVRATLSLLESGGRPVVRSIEHVNWPAPVLIGVRPLFAGEYARENAPAEFEVIRADATAALKAGMALPVRLFREDRQYYWRFDDQRGWHSGFTEDDELVATTQVSMAAGARGKLVLPVKYGRYRLEIFDPQTQQTLRHRFYAGWYARDDESQGVRPDRVALKLDKPAYQEGETAHLTLTPPHAGEALVTIEGDRTLWVRRMAVRAESMTIDIPIDKTWLRHDLYVSVMVLRPGNSGDRVTPARALGIAYLPLARDSRKLAVSLEAPQKMEPEQPLKVKIKVPEARGQQAMVTLSAVDAGILNITRFASPDPFGFFFGKLRYDVDAYDIYGRLIEKMDGQKGKLKWGGDAAPKPTRSLPKKVRLVDLFSGPVALDEQGEAEISLPVPDFNGSLRLMAVAAAGERYGMQESEVTVAAPLIVELATPRFLSVGDSALLALDVQNLAGSEQKVHVRISNDEGLVIHGGEQELTLKDQQKRILRIPLEAGSALGLTEVRINVDSPRVKLRRSFPLQVQAPTPRQSILRRKLLAAGESFELKETDLSGLIGQSVVATLAASNQMPIDVRSAVHGLLTYPYGCSEQTTSTAYPHVFIDEEAARQFGLKPYTKAQRAEMLGKAIGRLSGMQAPSGGFSLWGNVSEYQYWLSAYVADFLADAREQGFGVPADMEKRADDFLLKGLQEGVAGLPRTAVKYDAQSVWNDWRYAGSGRFGVLAYGAYVLARQGKAPLATLRQLHESQAAAHSGLALVHLGIALKLMGDEARAGELIAAGLKKPRDERYWWGDYGSNLRDWALMYVLLDKHHLQPQGRENLIAQVAGEMSRKRYYSTQEKLALFLLGRNFQAQAGSTWAAEMTRAGKVQALGGKSTQYLPLTADALRTGMLIHNTDKNPLYLELNYSGNPQRMPAAQREAFDLKRTWYTPDGKELGNRPLRVGETLIVGVNVKTRSRVANAMIVDYVPAGVEIENLNIVEGERGDLTIGGVSLAQSLQNPRIQHVEFRDDRFVVATRLDGESNFFYRVRVVTPGRFVVPPTYAEDMYQPIIYGLAGGGDFITIEDGKAR